MNTSRLPTALSTLALSTLALSLLLAACGGGGEAAPPPAAPAVAAALDLFDAQGRALPSAAARVPARTEARTRSGLYASAEQLEWQELMAGPSTVVLDIDQLGPAGAALLAEQVRGWRAAGVDGGLAWFVRGGAEDEAAQLANRLSDEGVAPVFVVR